MEFSCRRKSPDSIRDFHLLAPSRARIIVILIIVVEVRAADVDVDCAFNGVKVQRPKAQFSMYGFNVDDGFSVEVLLVDADADADDAGDGVSCEETGGVEAAIMALMR